MTAKLTPLIADRPRVSARNSMNPLYPRAKGDRASGEPQKQSPFRSFAVYLILSTLAVVFLQQIVHAGDQPQASFDWEPGELIPPFLSPHHSAHHGDWIPNYSLVANKCPDQNGQWDKVFRKNLALKDGDVVLIKEGVKIIYNAISDVKLKALVVEGELVFANHQNTRLIAETILVKNRGLLTINNSNAAFKTEIIFSGGVDTGEDPGQFQLGLVAGSEPGVSGGAVFIRGAATRTPFTMLQEPALAGEQVITAVDADGWQIGDSLYLVDSQRSTNAGAWSYFAYLDFPHQTERVKISGIDGNTIQLDRPLTYNHDRDVANIEKNIVFRSDLADANNARAHFLLGGSVDAHVSNAMFVGMGRTTNEILDDSKFDHLGNCIKVGTNQRARYAVHVHHAQRSFIFDSLSVVPDRIVNPSMGSPRWGIVNHDSYGLVNNSLVIGAAGAGIVAEEGPETGSFRGNLIIGLGGGTGDFDEVGGARGALNNAVNAEGTKVGHNDFGHGGHGVWTQSPFVKIEENRFAGYFKLAAFSFWGFHRGLHASSKPGRGYENIPDVPRDIQELDDDGWGGTENVNVRGLPIISFKDNELDAITGLSPLFLFYLFSPEPSIFQGGYVRLRTRYRSAVYTNNLRNLHLHDLHLIGSGTLTDSAYRKNQESEHLKVSDSIIEDFGVGFKVPGWDTELEDNVFRNNRSSIIVQHDFSQLRPEKQEKTILVKDNQFTGGRSDILMDFKLPRRSEMYANGVEGILTQYQTRVNLLGYHGGNYQVYFKEQHPSYIVESSYPSFFSSSEDRVVPEHMVGKSNRELPIPINGAMAPVKGTNSLAKIAGFVKPMPTSFLETTRDETQKIDYDTYAPSEKIGKEVWPLKSKTDSVASRITTIEKWKQFHFGKGADSAAAANHADYDGDGVANLLEYAAGSNPAQADTAKDRENGFDLYWSSRLDRPIGMEVRLDAGAALDPGLRVTVQQSADMKTWTKLTSRDGSGSWDPLPPTEVVSGTEENSYIFVTGLPHESEPVFLRLAVKETAVRLKEPRERE